MDPPWVGLGEVRNAWNFATSPCWSMSPARSRATVRVGASSSVPSSGDVQWSHRSPGARCTCPQRGRHNGRAVACAPFFKRSPLILHDPLEADCCRCRRRRCCCCCSGIAAGFSGAVGAQTPQSPSPAVSALIGARPGGAPGSARPAGPLVALARRRLPLGRLRSAAGQANTGHSGISAQRASSRSDRRGRLQALAGGR